MDMSVGDNGWDEWRKYVLAEMKRIGDCYCGLQETVNDMRS